MRPDSGVSTGSAPSTRRTTSQASAWSAPAASCSCSVELPTEAFSSSGVPSATLRPWSMTAIRSASWSASSRYCVVSRTVQPSATRLADRVPHLAAGARVQAGGRLVEEDQRRPRDQARREVEPPAHAAGELRERPVGGLLEPELLEQAPAVARASAERRPCRRPNSHRFSVAGEVLVDRRVLAGDADQLADAMRLAGRRRRRRSARRPRRSAAAWRASAASWSCRHRSARGRRRSRPGCTSRSMPSTARRSPKVFTRPRGLDGGCSDLCHGRNARRPWFHHPYVPVSWRCTPRRRLALRHGRSAGAERGAVGDHGKRRARRGRPGRALVVHRTP